MGTYLVALSRPGPERHLVTADKDGAHLVPEQLLRAIPMMDIEVDNGNARQSVVVESALSRNRCVTKEAKAHGLLSFAMVPGRSRCE